jgi:uncharacterized protein (TIRG00374 family)
MVAARWLTWLVGLAILAAVVLVVRHVEEGQALFRLSRRASPYWLLAAVALQAATYPCQSQVWRVVLRAAGSPPGLWASCQLTLARLAVDQALPAAGLGGTLFLAKALERRGITWPVVMASVVIDTASCYTAYAFGLAAALVIAVSRYHAPAPVVGGTVLFFVFALAIIFGAFALAGRDPGPLARRISRMRLLGAGLRMLREADPRLVQSSRLFAEATACQLGVVLLDAATIWVLIASLGVKASAAGVFASFTMSTLLRLIGISPGGLGVFEAASVFTLRMSGVDLSVALSATLLFRGLSFWLPLAPGLWLARRGLS